jgi:hypothetical protein
MTKWQGDVTPKLTDAEAARRLYDRFVRDFDPYTDAKAYHQQTVPDFLRRVIREDEE